MKIFSPEGTVQVKISWIFTFLSLFMGIAFAAGGYKAGFQNQDKELMELKVEMKELTKEFNNLRFDMSSLTISLQDLKQSVDRRK